MFLIFLAQCQQAAVPLSAGSQQGKHFAQQAKGRPWTWVPQNLLSALARCLPPASSICLSQGESPALCACGYGSTLASTGPYGPACLRSSGRGEQEQDNTQRKANLGKHETSKGSFCSQSRASVRNSVTEGDEFTFLALFLLWWS